MTSHNATDVALGILIFALVTIALIVAIYRDLIAEPAPRASSAQPAHPPSPAIVEWRLVKTAVLPSETGASTIWVRTFEHVPTRTCFVAIGHGLSSVPEALCR